VSRALVTASFERQEKFRKAVEVLKTLRKELDDLKENKTKGQFPDDKRSPDGKEVPAAIEEFLSKKEEVTEALSETWSGDLAAFVLNDTVVQGYALASQAQAGYHIISADKKGNVVYLRTQTVFDGVLLEASTSPVRIYLDEEIFFIAGRDKGLLVRIRIPSKDLRSEAYAWTQAWLTSLRIPID
jgi:hypothetical protein